MTRNRLDTQTKADQLLALYGGFHDSCIREIHIIATAARWCEVDDWIGPELGYGRGV